LPEQAEADKSNKPLSNQPLSNHKHNQPLKEVVEAVAEEEAVVEEEDQLLLQEQEQLHKLQHQEPMVP